ncbi:regulatory protein luxO, partial [Vibrio harveyi]
MGKDYETKGVTGRRLY